VKRTREKRTLKVVRLGDHLAVLESIPPEALPVCSVGFLLFCHRGAIAVRKRARGGKGPPLLRSFFLGCLCGHPPAHGCVARHPEKTMAKENLKKKMVKIEKKSPIGGPCRLSITPISETNSHLHPSQKQPRLPDKTDHPRWHLHLVTGLVL